MIRNASLSLYSNSSYANFASINAKISRTQVAIHVVYMFLDLV